MIVYLSHSIRGSKGEAATPLDMKQNCDAAIVLGRALQKSFPSLEFYIPAYTEPFVQLAYQLGFMSIRDILGIDCDIISRCDAVIVYVPPGDTLQGGRLTEQDYAIAKQIPTCVFHEKSEVVDWLTHFILRS